MIRNNYASGPRSKRLKQSANKYKKSLYKSSRSAAPSRSYNRMQPSNFKSAGTIGFPKMMKMVHRYVYGNFYTSLTTAGGPVSQQFRCNGMYDPDYTNLGHQPLYFDQMTPLYDHYCVIGSKVTWKVTALASNTQPIDVVFCIDDDASLRSPFIMAEQSNSIVKYLDFNNPIEYTQTWSAKKWFNKNPLANTELQGTPTTDPTEQSYFAMLVSPADGITTTQSFHVVATIEYIAIWKELKDVASS